MTQHDTIQELLTRGVDEIIERPHLEERLQSGEKLRVKFGIDPTSPYLHLGHSVPLRKLRQFQEMGHQVILLIGDYTAKIGDPSGRSEMRPMLTDADIKKNMKTYAKQASLILDMKRVEVRHNSEWYDKKGAAFLFELTSKFTVARILERDDFKKRIKEDVDVSMLEILYPLLQGYDSVALEADVEIGGTDQKFNLLMGRKVQKRYGMKEQDIMTVPLLEGLDGVQKMSKSLGNFVGLTEEADSMYGKIMSVPDALIVKYCTLLTHIPLDDIEKMKPDIRSGRLNPRDAKMRLAREIVTLYHSAKDASAAEENFVRMFQKHEAPEQVPECKVKSVKCKIADLLVETKLAASKSEARRLVEQKGVKVDERVVEDPDAVIEISKKGVLIQKGKRHFVRAVR